MEQALRVSISPGGSSYLQPSARPGNNTCIGLPWASHLTSLPHYNYEPCSPAGALGPAGNSCPGGRKGKRQLSFPGKKRLGLGMNMQDPALPAACWVSIIQRCSVTALYSQSSLPHQRETRLVTVREPVCSRPPGGTQASYILCICIWLLATIRLTLWTRATLPIFSGVRERWCGLQRGRQAVIYGAVGHLSPWDPTPTQRRTTDLSEQESDWAQTKSWKRNPATPCYYYPSTVWSQQGPERDEQEKTSINLTYRHTKAKGGWRGRVKAEENKYTTIQAAHNDKVNMLMYSG